MIQPNPSRKLPAHPDLDQLRHQARELLEAYRAGNSSAVDEVNRFYRGASPSDFALHHAQLVLARAYGFESWPRLKAYVDGITVERLAQAVKANDLDQVRAILRIRPELINVVVAWNNEHTALHFAVLGRMPEMVRLLMQHGANARAGISPHNDATSALTIATERDYTEIAAIIHEEEHRRAAEPPPPDQIPPELRSAFQSGDEDRIIEILERRPDLAYFQKPGDQRTLLHFASALLLQRVAAWLIDHGSAINQPDHAGLTPLDMVGSGDGMDTMVNLLRTRGASITARSAVILGDLDLLRTLHGQSNLTEPQDADGWLLRLAVDHNRSEILKLLLDLGLDPDARVRVETEGVEEIAFTWGMPLYECARHGKHEMAEILLERGADPNGQVYASGTPLSEAYGQRDERMIALLERYGGKSNPSMAGLYRRKDLALKLLAEHGDTPLPNDGFGSGTAAEQLISSAARGGDPEILQLGIDHVNWPDGDPRWYSGLGGPLGFWNHWIGPWCHQEWDRTTYLTCFKMILARLGPPNRQQRFGAMILHAIVTMGNHITSEETIAFAAAAIDAGARLDIRDDLLKSTPLGWAARWGREDLVRYLLDRGADPSEPGAEPWATPLAWAEKKGHHTIAALLRERSQS